MQIQKERIDTKKRKYLFRWGFFTALFLCGAYLTFFYDREAYVNQKADTDHATNILNQIKDTHVKQESEIIIIESGAEEESLYDESTEFDQTLKNPVKENQTEITTSQEETTTKEEHFELPSNAAGYLDCILDFPEIGLCKGVYGGNTWMDIHYNLNELYYLTTTAEKENVNCPILGKTAYLIQGHNSLRKNLAMNALLKARTGMHFTLYGVSAAYEYEVIAVYGMNRTASHEKIMNRLCDLPLDRCYLITCGRNTALYQFRYQNMIVEGKLIKKWKYE